MGQEQSAGTSTISLVNNTIALPRMSYENEVISILPGSADPVVSTRTGSFDDDTSSGVGTWALESDDPAVTEGFPPEAIEHRVVDEMYWYWSPYGQPPVWTGCAIVEFAETAGRLLEAGAGGILVEVEFDQDTEGFVSGFRISLSSILSQLELQRGEKARPSRRGA